MIPAIFVRGEPRAQPRGRTFVHPKLKRPVTVSTPSGHPVVAWRDALTTELLRHKPDEPIIGPVRLKLVFIMPRPRGHFKTSKGQLTNHLKPNAPYEHTKKPDLDNLEKPVKDVMKECGYYKDDGQVCDVEKTKYYVNDTGGPGCCITVTRVPARRSTDKPVLNPFPS